MLLIYANQTVTSLSKKKQNTNYFSYNLRPLSIIISRLRIYHESCHYKSFGGSRCGYTLLYLSTNASLSLIDALTTKIIIGQKKTVNTQKTYRLKLILLFNMIASSKRQEWELNLGPSASTGSQIQLPKGYSAWLTGGVERESCKKTLP